MTVLWEDHSLKWLTKTIYLKKVVLNFVYLMIQALEADDCIAITVKYIFVKIWDDAKIWIIASDMDYLQIASNKVKIYNLKYKDITESKNCFKNAEKGLILQNSMQVIRVIVYLQYSKNVESKQQRNTGMIRKTLIKNWRVIWMQ